MLKFLRAYVLFVSYLLIAAGAASAQDSPAVNAGPMDEIVTVSSGDWTLVGNLRLTASDEPAPVVILLHTLWGGKRAHYDTFAETLAEHGIASLRIDLRGHGDSTNVRPIKLLPEMDLDLIFEAWPDVNAARDFLADHPRIDPDRIGIVGASYSGELAARAGEEAGYAKAYAILASGLMSGESIMRLQESGTDWIYVVADDDHTWAPTTSQFVDKRGGEVWRYETGGHANALLINRQDFPERLARWFADKL